MSGGNKRWDELRLDLKHKQESLGHLLSDFGTIVRDEAAAQDRFGQIHQDLEGQRGTAIQSSIDSDLSDSQKLIQELRELAGKDVARLLQVKKWESVHSGFNVEFSRLAQSYEYAVQRARLIAAPDSPSHGGDSEQKQLLRERNALDGSITAADEAINQGFDTLQLLRDQRHRLTGAWGKGREIASAIPGVQTMMTRIRRLQLRNSTVLAVTVGFCILLTLLYVAR